MSAGVGGRPYGPAMTCGWSECGQPEFTVWVLRSPGRWPGARDFVWMVSRCEEHQDDEPPLLPGTEVIGSGGDPDVVRSILWR